MTKIQIYSTVTCGYCKMLKSYLQSKNIPYEEKHVDRDPALAQELFDRSNQLGVPFTVIEQDGKEPVAILGFDRQRIDMALGL